ncbi:MAG: leucine-rich repeat domain-containing protein [Bacteroidales bacterium]|nr:leucine-rich repeat domain-containing protein [Bacteroidales bacterium]
MGAETELLFSVTEFEYEIAGWAFKSRHDVTFVAFPICCRAVGSHSFGSCLRLTIVDTGPGIELIDFDAFSDCISLVNVIIGENVKRIEKNAFEDCDKIV